MTRPAPLDTLAGGKEAFRLDGPPHNAVNKECGRIAYDPQVARLLYGRDTGAVEGGCSYGSVSRARCHCVSLLLCRTAWKV
jgi:hypothetical protein